MAHGVMNYYLVLEARPGDFMPIDINLLLNDGHKQNFNSLESIDAFTKLHLVDDIYEMIKKANIVPDLYLSGELHVINDAKYRYKVITKEIEFSLDSFFIDYIDNKKVMNKFLNIFIKYNKEELARMKDAIETKDVYQILNILFTMSYEQVRNIYTYIIDNVIVEEEKRVLVQTEAA